MSLLLNILDKLPGAYSKDPDSNIGRLFQLFAAALSGVEEALQTVALWRDLDSARGRYAGPDRRQFRHCKRRSFGRPLPPPDQDEGHRFAGGRRCGYHHHDHQCSL